MSHRHPLAALAAVVVAAGGVLLPVTLLVVPGGPGLGQPLRA